MPDLTFTDLPLIVSQDELRRVHRTAGLFFVTRASTAHGQMTCQHLDDSTLVDNPKWRIANSAQCRKLGIPWCENCA